MKMMLSIVCSTTTDRAGRFLRLDIDLDKLGLPPDLPLSSVIAILAMAISEKDGLTVTGV